AGSGVLVHTLARQSSIVHGSPSSHADASRQQPGGVATGAGHAVDVPSQLSAGSHAFADGRQTAVVALAPQRPSVRPPPATPPARQSVGSPPPHGTSQHTASSQMPVAHASGAEHAVPDASPCANTATMPERTPPAPAPLIAPDSTRSTVSATD